MAQRVNVSGYYRRNGQYVSPHTRRAPSTATAAGGGLGLVALIAVLFWIIGQSSGPQPTATSTPTWNSGGLAFTRVASSNDLPCRAHSYGQVQQFLTAHPCQALTRALFETSTDQGQQILVAVSWTTMPTAADTGQLHGLADRPGSGNITELSRDTPAYATTTFTGTHYASTTNANTVVIAEAEALTGTSSVEVLNQAAHLALNAPRP